MRDDQEDEDTEMEFGSDDEDKPSKRRRLLIIERYRREDVNKGAQEARLASISEEAPVDITEVFSPPRITKVAAEMGYGREMHLTSGVMTRWMECLGTSSGTTRGRDA